VIVKTFNHFVGMMICLVLVGCSQLNLHTLREQNQIGGEIQHSRQELQGKGVVQYSDGAWLAGEKIKLSEPSSPLLDKSLAYHPARPVSVMEAAFWLGQELGIAVDLAALQSAASPAAGGASPGANSAPAGVTAPNLGAGNRNLLQQTFNIAWEGSVRGFLNELAGRSGAWWKLSEGKILFYRLETRTFYLPAVARKFSGNSTITTNSSGSNSASGGTGTQATAAGITSQSGAGGMSDFTVDFWTDLEKTARTVAGPLAQVAINPSSGSITVTGNPVEVRHVEDWVKQLAQQMSQQVLIDIKIYTVRLNQEDNYNWNPGILFRQVSGSLGFNITGVQSPSVSAGLNPANLGLSLVSAAGNSTPYSGSTLAFNALSSLGRVTERISQSVVTLNGQPAPVQMATQQGYLASSATTLSANVGSTSTLTPGTLTTGFTALFLPRIVNGKIILGMAMTSSTLNSMTTVTSGQSSIQNPNVDSNTFQQSVSLTPGEALMLTGLWKDTSTTLHNGTLSPDNYIVGGGVDEGGGKQIVAIVITARIL
jgi:type IVB pilus formation R64 PilN family outer membrane protein